MIFMVILLFIMIDLIIRMFSVFIVIEGL